MQLQHRRFLSYALLAVYATISFLGDGLHSLMPEAGHEHHHHHHGLYIVAHAHECGDCDHDDHDECCQSDGVPVLTASDCDGDSHLCEVCSFLFQSLSQPAEVAAPIDWQPLVVATTVSLQPVLHSPATLGPQAPRGPPLLLA
jgi:hypothetical protein